MKQDLNLGPQSTIQRVNAAGRRPFQALLAFSKDNLGAASCQAELPAQHGGNLGIEGRRMSCSIPFDLRDEPRDRFAPVAIAYGLARRSLTERRQLALQPVGVMAHQHFVEMLTHLRQLRQTLVLASALGVGWSLVSASIESSDSILVAR
jgi:hypothetical protein